MSAQVDVISIGTLERNRLWNESAPMRTPHATTSLIRIGKRAILVDPGLPPQILMARLGERIGFSATKIDTIFLTSFTFPHRAGLAAFPDTPILMWEPEIEEARRQTQEFVDRELGDEELQVAAEQTLALLERVTPVEDKLYDGPGGDVDLFPLPGHTAGTAGLLVTSPTLATLIAGDAVPTREHFLAGQVLPDAANVQQAQESLREAYEIADIIVPGRDNLFVNPRAQGAM